MEFELSIRPEAEADLANSFDFYQECRLGLGTDLLLCVEECLERMKRNPFQFPQVYKTVHRALIHRFPYALFFVVTEQQVVVLAVMHASQSPKRWQSRA
jgi:plasmid stabilization system protein ParE